MEIIFKLNMIFEIFGTDDVLFHGEVLHSMITGGDIQNKDLYIDISKLKDNKKTQLHAYLTETFKHVIDYTHDVHEHPDNICHKFVMFIMPVGKKQISIITHDTNIVDSALFNIDRVCFSNKGMTFGTRDDGPMLNTLWDIKLKICRLADPDNTHKKISECMSTMLQIIHSYNEKIYKGYTIKDGLKYKEKYRCPVCLDEKVVFEFDCTHSLCCSCMSDLFIKTEDNRCPLCRSTIKLLFGTITS